MTGKKYATGTDVPMFSGDDMSGPQAKKCFARFQESFSNHLATLGLHHVLSRDDFFGPGKMPEVTTEPRPEMPEMFPVNAMMPLAEQLSATNTNRAMMATYHSELNMWNKRYSENDDCALKARAVLMSCLVRDSTAANIMNSYALTEDVAFEKFISGWEALTAKWTAPDVTTKDELYEELKAATDENGLAERISTWTRTVNLLETMGNLPSDAELNQWFQKGTKNEYLRSSVITPWQTQLREFDTWRQAADVMQDLIIQNPEKDMRKSSASASSRSEVVTAAAVTMSEPSGPPVPRCYICGYDNHRAAACRSPSCGDCGMRFANAQERSDHFGRRCPTRRSNQPANANRRTNDGKKAGDGKKRQGNPEEKGERSAKRFKEAGQEAKEPSVKALLARLLDKLDTKASAPAANDNSA